MSTCSAAEIAEKKRIAQEKLRAKRAQLQAAVVAAPNYTTKSPTSNSKTQNNNNNKDNKASTFLNALKQSTVFTHRKELRDSVHPYNRATTNNSNNNNNTYDNATHKPLLALSPKKPLAPVFVNSVTCKPYVISATHFAVQTSSYHSKLIEVFKGISSKSYNTNTRIWSFAIKDYALLHERVTAMKPQVLIGNIPKSILKLCAQPALITDSTCLAEIDRTLAEKLLPFQRDGVSFAIAQAGRIMICDEMGLGKTFQALAIADYYKDNWPLLVCTTASTRESWASHIRSLLPTVPLHYVQVFVNNQQYVGDAKILITSYNMMEKNLSMLLERKFGVLIFDESHTLKNSKAKCTVVADRLAQLAQRIILLSGTPALSRPVELFSQLQMIDRKFMSFKEYTTRYCDGKQTHFGWDATGQSNLEELNVVLKLKFMIRRTKMDVLPELSEKLRETVVLDPTLVWPSDAVKASLSEMSDKMAVVKGKEREEMLLKFYAETANVKIRAVCAYLKTLVQENVKFIIFAHHRIMLDAICDCLGKMHVKFVRIDGSTRNELRAEYIDIFQKNSSCQVAVLSLKACNSGITLTAAEMIVFAELDWNPSTLAQAESRAHRIGQEKQVICRYLMASKTADDVIWNMLKNKQDVLNRAGLFCENLQDASHTAAPTTSHKIERYFSPDKTKEEKKQQTITQSNANKEALKTIEKTSSSTNHNLNKELENIDEFFKDVTVDEKTSNAFSHLSKELDSIEAFFKDADEKSSNNSSKQLSKELENIDEFFNVADDDELFKNLQC